MTEGHSDNIQTRLPGVLTKGQRNNVYDDLKKKADVVNLCKDDLP